MAKPYIVPPTASEIVHGKAWDLADYFGKEFPKASLKIEVKYHNESKYCIIHEPLTREVEV